MTSDRGGSTGRDLLRVTLYRSGSMTVTQDDRYCRVRPGDLVAYETSRPYQLIGTDVCDIVVIGIPRPMLGASADLISRRTAVALLLPRVKGAGNGVGVRGDDE